MQTEEQIRAEVVELIGQLAGDWEYSGPVTPSTHLLADLGLESLDLVVIGTTLQDRYGKMPFAEFLAEIRERPVEERDVSIGDLASFVCQQRIAPAAGGAE